MSARLAGFASVRSPAAPCLPEATLAPGRRPEIWKHHQKRKAPHHPDDFLRLVVWLPSDQSS